ncbi:NHL repeat-containing protein [Limnoglobus roseus]|uniref:Tandem-95 repeat protein n=1 Tax=Limnoglobus roseus TaxID=2598579 RepID=A0A5C1AMJ7_9BACT|nr:SMP-30/gluconolactonase/LRE family protein [Limnoglobus roseus]QEL19196.1 tandem-95 repeat protein [Limnoglobus roseus]
MSRIGMRSRAATLLEKCVNLLTPPSAAPATRRRNAGRTKLSCEPLESRDTPTTFTWAPTEPGNYDWTNKANWGGSGYPNAAGDVANITSTLLGNQVINLNDPITIGSITIGGSSTVGTFTIAGNYDGGTDGSLTFDVTSGSASLTTTSTGGGAILAPIVLADNLTLTGGSNTSGTAPIGLGGDISGTGTITASNTTNLLNNVSIGSNVNVAGTGTFSAVQAMYSTSYYDNAVYAFNSATGKLLATLYAPQHRPSGNPQPAPAGLLFQPAGLEVGPDGNLYISSQLNNKILRYNFATDQMETFISDTVLQGIASAESQTNFAPAGLRFGPDGDLYVSMNVGFTSASKSGAIYRFDVSSSGGLSYAGTNTRVVDNMSQPAGLAFGIGSDSSSLYIGNSVFGGISKVANAPSASSATPTTFVSPNSGGLQFPAGLNWGPDGDLYVTDLAAVFGYGQVLRYDSSGAFVNEVVGSPVFFPQPGDLNNQFPSDVLFDPSGNLLVVCLGPKGPTTGSNDYEGSIRRYDIGGTYDQDIVSFSNFPDTDASAGGASGIIPSQAVIGKMPTLTFAGALQPNGSSAGTISIAGAYFAFTSAGDYAVNLNSTGTGGADKLSSDSKVDLGSATLAVTLAGGFTPAVNTVFTIVSASSGLTGTFDGLADNATFTAGGLGRVDSHGCLRTSRAEAKCTNPR